jgi:hypothetical protein
LFLFLATGEMCNPLIATFFQIIADWKPGKPDRQVEAAWVV